MRRRYIAMAVVMFASVPTFAYIGDPSLFGPQYYHYMAIFAVVWGLASIITTLIARELFWAIGYLRGNTAEE